MLVKHVVNYYLVPTYKRSSVPWETGEQLVAVGVASLVSKRTGFW